MVLFSSLAVINTMTKSSLGATGMGVRRGQADKEACHSLASRNGPWAAGWLRPAHGLFTPRVALHAWVMESLLLSRLLMLLTLLAGGEHGSCPWAVCPGSRVPGTITGSASGKGGMAHNSPELSQMVPPTHAGQQEDHPDSEQQKDI